MMGVGEMFWHTVDYRKDSAHPAWVNRGFWLHNTPRLIPLCRLRGHRVVVDGVDMKRFGQNLVQTVDRSRWACCDRCGIRLQQPIDSDLEIGQPYTDPIPASTMANDVTGATGTIGGQLVLGGGYNSVSAEVKVGNAGSEHTLAAHVHLHKLGALYLHTERHGTWLQRRLNPTGYESRVTGFSAHDGTLHWRLWAKRDGSSRRDPRWQRGSFGIDPRTALFGPLRYSYEDVGDPVEAVVRMPHGDDHTVTLQLQRVSFGRRRLRRKKVSWSADWESRPGIPTRNTDRGRIQGSGVTLTEEAAAGEWVASACSAIAAQMTADRVRYGYQAQEVGA